MKFKRGLALLLAAGTLTATMAGCGGDKKPAADGSASKPQKSVYEMTEEELVAAAKEEGSVTFAVWHYEDLWREIGEGFTEKYGIKFDVAMGEQQALTNKALAEKESEVGSIDVMKVGGEHTKITYDAGLFMGPTLPSIAAKDVLDEGLSVRQEGVEHNGYLVPLHLNQTGLLINPDKVPNPPQTWEELEAWIDENPKRFGFCDPSKGGSGQAFVFSAIGNLLGGYDNYYGDTEVEEADVKDWDKVWQWFNERKDKMTITTSNKDSLARLNQGELYMVVGWDDLTVSTMKSGELFKEAKLYIPKFGLPGGGDTAGIMKNAPHPAASLLLLNYFTSPEVQQKFNEVLNTYPARNDVEVVNTSIAPEDFANRTSWIPAQYKQKFINDFVANVLMVG